MEHEHATEHVAQAAHTQFSIPIRCDQFSPPRWLLLELQGDLLIPDVAHALPSAFAGLDLGHFEDGALPVLLIGNHRLEGKRNKLPKPYAIVRKSNSNKLDVVGLVEDRIIFKTRPKPISHAAVPPPPPPPQQQQQQQQQKKPKQNVEEHV